MTTLIVNVDTKRNTL